MSAAKWRVSYRPGHGSWTNIWGETTDFEMRPWLVEKIGRGGKERRFDTLPEAHTYATRQSRTITVELPVDLSSAPISGSWKDPTESWIREYCDPDIGPENSIRLSDDQLEAFALALLSRHHQRKAQQ